MSSPKFRTLPIRHQNSLPIDPGRNSPLRQEHGRSSPFGQEQGRSSPFAHTLRHQNSFPLEGRNSPFAHELGRSSPFSDMDSPFSDTEKEFEAMRQRMKQDSSRFLRRDLDFELDRLCEGLFKEEPFIDTRSRPRPTLHPLRTGGTSRVPKECIIEGANGARKFQASLAIPEFDPETISVTVNDDSTATVRANKAVVADGNRTVTELNRSFHLPREVDSDKITSRLAGNGVLYLEAPLPPDYQYIESEVKRKKEFDGPEVPKYYYTQDGRKEMAFVINIGSGFEPDDMQVNVNDRVLEIKAFRDTSSDGTTKRISFSRSYELTEAVDPDSIKAHLIDNTKLRISATVPEKHMCLVQNCTHENHA